MDKWLVRSDMIVIGVTKTNDRPYVEQTWQHDTANMWQILKDRHDTYVQ